MLELTTDTCYAQLVQGTSPLLRISNTLNVDYLWLVGREVL